MNLQGIDVSVHNGKIDWDEVGQQSSVRFAMVRASYGKNSRDDNFKENVAGARSQALGVGAYHFCYAESIEEAHAEALNFLDAVKGQKLNYPLVLDLESNSSTDKAAAILSDIAVAFLNDVEDAGYFAMLYSDKNHFENYFDAEKIAPFAAWVAQWAKKNTYKGPCGIWQYSDSGKVPGISAAVDLNVSYHDYAQIIYCAGLNHLCD